MRVGWGGVERAVVRTRRSKVQSQSDVLRIADSGTASASSRSSTAALEEEGTHVVGKVWLKRGPASELGAKDFSSELRRSFKSRA